MKGTQVNTCPAGSSQPQLFITHAMDGQGGFKRGLEFHGQMDMEVMRKTMQGKLDEALALAKRLNQYLMSFMAPVQGWNIQVL